MFNIDKIIKLEENQDQIEGLFLGNCWYCDKKIEFLPFKCKFCGNSFCGDHRLPESHECPVEFKQGSYDREDIIIPPKKYAINSRGQVKDYRTRRSQRPQSRVSARLQSLSQLNAAQLLIFLNISMLILNFILSFFPGTAYLFFLSFSDYIPPNFNYFTIFTATIIPNTMSSFWDILSLLFFLIIIYFMAKSIETSFGRNTALKIYFSGALIASASILLMLTLFTITSYDSVIFPPILISQGIIFTLADLSFYSSYGGLIALVTFRSIVYAEQPVRFYLYFIPVNMRMKHMKWIFIGLEFISVLIGGIFFIQSISNILGALGGIMFAATVLRNQYSARRF